MEGGIEMMVLIPRVGLMVRLFFLLRHSNDASTNL